MYQDLQNIQNAVNNLDSLITQKDNAITQLDVAVAERDAKIEALTAALAATKVKASGFSHILSNMQKLAWIQPGPLGNSNPSPDDPHGTFIQIPGEVAKWHCKPIESWNNGFWYRKMMGFEQFTRFAITAKMTLPKASDIAACNAVELQWQKSLDGYIYNMAWQVPGAKAGQAKYFWRTFDFVNKEWIATEIPTKAWVPGVPVLFYAEGVVDTVARTVTHLSLGIDDMMYYPSITRPAKAQKQANYLSTGFQLDTLGRNKSDGTKDTSWVPPEYDFETTEQHLLY